MSAKEIRVTVSGCNANPLRGAVRKRFAFGRGQLFTGTGYQIIVGTEDTQDRLTTEKFKNTKCADQERGTKSGKVQRLKAIMGVRHVGDQDHNEVHGKHLCKQESIGIAEILGIDEGRHAGQHQQQRRDQDRVTDEASQYGPVAGK